MSRKWITRLPQFVLFMGLSVKVFAQDISKEQAAERARQAEAAIAAQQQLDAQRQMQELEKGQAALRDFLSTNQAPRRIAPSAQAELKAKFFEFRQSIPKFRAAVDDYRWKMSMGEKFDKSLKSIDAQTDVMLRYLNSAKMKHPRPDGTEFKDYSTNELAWEMLNSGERISAYLDLAVAVESQEIVSPKALEFMYTLNGELLRLKWLAAHVK